MKFLVKQLAGIILAAGKGTRFPVISGNKVLLPLFDKPLILYAVEALQKICAEVLVVVGYQKEEIQKTVGQAVTYVEQKEQLGTFHAVSLAVNKLRGEFDAVLVLMADHGFGINQSLLLKLYRLHKKENASITLLTVLSKSIYGYGKVIRDDQGDIRRIVDTKTDQSSKDKSGEITPGIYCFKADFLRKSIGRIQKNPTNGEYYLSDLVELAYMKGEKIKSITSHDQRLAVGINTMEDYKKVKKMFENNLWRK